MRICLVANATSIHTKRWASWFAQNGHDVHIVSFWDAEIKGVTVHHIKLLPSILTSLKNSVLQRQPSALSVKDTPTEKALKSFRSTLMSYFTLISQPLDNWRIKRTIKRIKPDILHGHYVTSYGFYAACSGFHPLVITAWGSDVLIDPGLSRFNRHRVEFALKRADLIICEGENLRERMIQFGAIPDRIKKLYWAVDTEIFSPDKKDDMLHHDLGLSGSPVVISTRSLNPVYDIETLVKAVPLVLAQVPETRFIIGGSGTQAVYLKRLSQSLGIADNMRFVGEVPYEDMPKYLALADIYVCTSLSDGGFALSTKEAMSCGLPVVVTDFGDSRKWVHDGVNGFVVPLSNPGALASKIVYLLSHKDDWRKMGQVNRRMVEEKANWEREMGKLEKLYEELVERGKN